jgi:hypothetical protein
VRGKGWGSMRTARATVRWARLGLEMAGVGLPAEQWGGGMEVARRRPSSEPGAAWGSWGASGGHRKLIQGLDSGGSGA